MTAPATTPELNCTEILIGCQGSGKSWHSMKQSALLADKHDCPLVIHDTGTAAIRNTSNPFYNADWKSYTDSTPPKTLAASHPPIIVVNTADAEDALLYAQAVKKNGNVVLLIDEVTASEHIRPQHIGGPWRRLVAQRRAERIAFFFCMQYPSMASRFLTSTATAIKCFRITHDDNLKALAKMGYDSHQLTLIEKLPRGQFIELKQGFPA